MLWFLKYFIAGLHGSTAWSQWRQHQKAFIWKHGRLSGWMFWRGFKEIWNETKGTWENTKTRTCGVRHCSQPIILSKRTFHAKSTNQPFFILKIINKKSLLIGYHMIYKMFKIPQTVLTVARQHDIYTGAKESENYWMHSMRADLNQARFFSTYIIFLGRKNKKASDQVSVVMRLDSVYTCILHQYLDIVNGSVKDSKEDNVCVLSYL